MNTGLVVSAVEGDDVVRGFGRGGGRRGIVFFVFCFCASFVVGEVYACLERWVTFVCLRPWE